MPISYHGRTYAEGKNIGWRDGVQAMWLLFRFRFLDTRFTDDHGRATLESIGTSPQVSRWIVGQFDGAIGNRVFEAGAGIGNITSLLLARERMGGSRCRPVVRAQARPSVRASRELLGDRGAISVPTSS